MDTCVDKCEEETESGTYTVEQILKDDNISESTKDRVRQFLGERETDYEWWDCLYDEWKNRFQAMGFYDVEINFSGFCSQGDGASFTGKVSSLGRLLYALDKWEEDRNAFDTGALSSCELEITNDMLLEHTFDFPIQCVELYYNEGELIFVERVSHHYSHENTCSWNYHSPMNEQILTALYGTPPYDDSPIPETSIWKRLEKFRYHICKCIYRDLEKEYEYRTSDECFLEMEYDYLFDEEGNEVS